MSTRTYAPAIRYYGVGIYMYQGSARAWDSAGAIGVISHPVAVAPPFAVESVFMAAAGRPEVAWVALRSLPSSLTTWLNLPRFVRELTAVYAGEDELMTLRDLREALDAVVIVKLGHDSSPTATGVRVAKPS
ncbi:MAG: hypothetical protein H7138_05920 [Myxococcales bacterium]|nr:hypothetical protein [Myxococcales bacterium]